MKSGRTMSLPLPTLDILTASYENINIYYRFPTLLYLHIYSSELTRTSRH